MLNAKEITNKEIEFDEPKKVFSKTLVELGKKDERVVFISCDTSLGTGANEFKTEFPKRHFDFGIAEQNAVSHAAGMAVEGKIPFIGAHAPFISIKVLEQIRNDLCKTQLHAILVGRDFGFQGPNGGPTHMVFEEVGVLRTIPGITIIAPCDGPEYRKAMIAAYNFEGPVYIRMSRIKAKRINKEDYNFKIGKGVILKEGRDITLFATSTLVSNTLDAAWNLQKKGISAEVINMHTLKPIDSDIILKSCSKTGHAVTIEEHSVINGLGSAVAEVLIKNNPVKMKMIGIEDHFSIVGANYEELIDYYGFTPEKLSLKIEEYLEKF
jgi:transketolase